MEEKEYLDFGGKDFIIDLQLRLLQENLVGILKTLEQG